MRLFGDMVRLQRGETQQPSETPPVSDDLILQHQRGNGRFSLNSRRRSNYHQLQFRRMYRYGLALLLIGALCNWIGFAQLYFAPVRYLGVGCIIAGVVCICIALCRWLTVRSNDAANSQNTSYTEPNIHVIAVSVQSGDPFQAQQPAVPSKPPDYETVVGAKPPSYDEAVKICPATLLNSCPGAVSLAEPVAPLPVNNPLYNRPPSYTIDCPRCAHV